MTARRSRVVEGKAGYGFGDDGPQNGLEVVQDLFRRNAHRLDARAGKPGVAGFVALRPISAPVRLSVDLDGEARVVAEEVERIGSAGC
jgi:hypothetical protein